MAGDDWVSIIESDTKVETPSYSDAAMAEHPLVRAAFVGVFAVFACVVVYMAFLAWKESRASSS